MARPTDDADLAFRLATCQQARREHAALGAQLADLERRAAELARETEAARWRWLRENEEADLAHGAGPTTWLARWRGTLDAARAKESAEALEAALAYADLVARVEDARAEAALVRDRLAALAPVLARWDELVAERDQRLRTAGDPRLGSLTRIEDEMANWDGHAKDLFAALVTCESILIGLQDLQGVNPAGPMAGKADVLAEGLAGWGATARKYANMRAYDAKVMALRDLMRELDASPVVHAPELVDLLPFTGVGADMQGADFWT